MLRRLLAIGSVLLGCSCARACAPGTVAQGTSRLTVRTFGAIVERINADERCGFAAAPVLAAPEIIADGGGRGTGRVIYAADDCELDFSRAPNVGENCSGTVTEIRGRAIVTARRTVRGTLTGDPNNPVIPGGPDAVSIEIRDAVLEEFSVKSDSIDAELIIHSGSIRGTAEPRIAKSATLKICKIPTRDIYFSDLRWGPSHARLLSDGHDIDVDIDGSALDAVLGRREAGENELSGTINIWGSEHHIPVDGDDDGLLPGYDRESFVEEFDCAEDLEQPLTFECSTFGELMADGASKLTVLAFGTVLKKVNDGTSCTFEGPRVEGPLGERGGKAVWSLGSSGCALEGVTVRGTKTIHGIVSGDSESPVIPTEHYPAELELTLDFNEFSVSTDDQSRTLHVGSGSLSGLARPYLELDPSTRACSTPTENVNLRALTWSNANARIESQGKRFNVAIADSALDADVGLNTLDGSITVNGESHEQHGPILSPRVNDAECSLNAMLGEAVARLTVRSLGAISRAINADAECGFESAWVKLWPTNDTGSYRELGTLEHTARDCGLEFSESSTDCLGREQQRRGGVTVTAVRTVRGLRDLPLIKSIVPLEHDSVVLQLDVDFDNFLVDEDERMLTVERGKVLAEVHPMTGERASKPGVFDVPTPIAHFASVRFENVQTVLRANGKTFRVKIDRGEVEAHNGSFNGRANAIRGELVVEGETVQIGLMNLQPEYDQADFDARYACTEDLVGLVPSAGVPPPSL